MGLTTRGVDSVPEFSILPLAEVTLFPYCLLLLCKVIWRPLQGPSHNL